MKNRCNQPSNPAFAHYHRRGITVCERWQHSFENFFADMGERPEGTTIDRIDNDKGYEPSNCRWATKKEQSNNRFNNHRFEYQGRTFALADLARHTGVPHDLLRSRLIRKQRGQWTVELAVSTPPLNAGNRR